MAGALKAKCALVLVQYYTRGLPRYFVHISITTPVPVVSAWKTNTWSFLEAPTEFLNLYLYRFWVQVAVTNLYSVITVICSI